MPDSTPDMSRTGVEYSNGRAGMKARSQRTVAHETSPAHARAAGSSKAPARSASGRCIRRFCARCRYSSSSETLERKVFAASARDSEDAASSELISPRYCRNSTHCGGVTPRRRRRAFALSTERRNQNDALYLRAWRRGGITTPLCCRQQRVTAGQYVEESHRQ